MSRQIGSSIKQIVIKRANNRCEYCQLEDELSYISHQIDHIISLKHGGSSDLDNLAYSCFACNNNKGSDIGTVVPPTLIFSRLFNPRTDKWDMHFEHSNGLILPKSLIGEATIKVLKMNSVEKIIERKT